MHLPSAICLPDEVKPQTAFGKNERPHPWEGGRQTETLDPEARADRWLFPQTPSQERFHVGEFLLEASSATEKAQMEKGR